MHNLLPEENPKLAVNFVLPYLKGQCMIWTVDHTLSHTIPLNKLGHQSC